MKFVQKSIEIPCGEVCALAWDGDEIVDVTTNRRLRLDGTLTGRAFFLGYPFDRGLCLRSPDALWTVAYDNRGTKAVLLKNGKIHRELNRSYYFAKAYDYPITLTRSSAGRTVVVHCPSSYDELTFEDADSGEVLTVKKSRNMEFHSRLAATPDGQLLVSAGWFWHPLCGAWLFPQPNNLGARSELSEGTSFSFGAEIDSVAFHGNDNLVLATTNEVVNEDVPLTGLGPMRLGVWSIPQAKWTSVVEIAQNAGMLMPWRNWVISFHDHPKAIDLTTGEVVFNWPDLYSGRQVGAIEIGEPAPPPLALDPLGGRFAVGGPKGVTIITLDQSE